MTSMYDTLPPKGPPPPKPPLSLKAKAGFGAVLAIAVMLARYVGVDVPECEQCPACPVASEAP